MDGQAGRERESAPLTELALTIMLDVIVDVELWWTPSHEAVVNVELLPGARDGRGCDTILQQAARFF